MVASHGRSGAIDELGKRTDVGAGVGMGVSTGVGEEDGFGIAIGAKPVSSFLEKPFYIFTILLMVQTDIFS